MLRVLALGLVLLAAAPSAGHHDYWTDAPNMRVPLTEHLATTLSDGRVLVAGGYETLEGWSVPYAQIYDPRTRRWSVAKPMHTARTAETATLLHDGRVLVVGGLGVRLRPLSSAEIYDPRRNTWTLTPRLPATRFSHSATLLPDGRVLVIGGIVNKAISRSVLLYDPKSNRWVKGPSTIYRHAQQDNVWLPRGRIFVVGGYGGGPEMYDIRTGRWHAAGATDERIHPVVAGLANGSVLLAGGEGTSFHDLRSSRIFLPWSNRWIAARSLHTSRNYATSLRLADGDVLVAGGEQVTQHVLRSVELFRPHTGQWVLAAPLRLPRGGATATLLHDGTVLECGGANLDGVLVSCEIYHP